MPVISAPIASGTLAASETAIATLVAPSVYPLARSRIRGHVNLTGNATAGTVTLRVRQGSATGTLLYTAVASVVASGKWQIVFEVEDTSGWMWPGSTPSADNQTYVITAVHSVGTGTIDGGYACVEALG